MILCSNLSIPRDIIAARGVPQQWTAQQRPSVDSRARIWGVAWCDTAKPSVPLPRNTSATERTVSATCWAPTLPARWHRDRTALLCRDTAQSPPETQHICSQTYSDVIIWRTSVCIWPTTTKRILAPCSQQGMSANRRERGGGLHFGWWWRWVWNERINTRTKGIKFTSWNFIPPTLQSPAQSSAVCHTATNLF